HRRITASSISTIVSSLLGVFTLLLWWRQRESLFLWYACGELLWALQSLDLQIVHEPLPLPWWQCISLTAYALAPACLGMFSLKFMEQDSSLQRRLIWLYICGTPVVVGITEIATWPELWQYWKIILVILSCYWAYAIVKSARFSSAIEERVLAASVLIILLMALRDGVVLILLTKFAEPPVWNNPLAKLVLSQDLAWTRYGWGLFGGSLAWIITERLRRARLHMQEANAHLKQKLSEREAELHQLFALQIEVKQQQATIEERQRLTRDMHDGLGAQLIATMHMAQNQEITRLDLTHQIRDTLDHLKLTVDAMQETDGDLATLLGSLRYRLGPRLKNAGVQLHWDVAPLPHLPNWGIQQSRDLQMLLFEALSNLMMHAKASNANLSAHADKDNIYIGLSDDGVGIAEEFLSDVSKDVKGNGLRNMRLRANKLHAELAIENQHQGASISLSIPMSAYIHQG
ncbi:MAG: hypothetical protein K2P84_10995, partial [Undibacterium sp.]|nr:hypothetical protein [Undibacterium sp.]